jgi:hypothetical protein
MFHTAKVLAQAGIVSGHEINDPKGLRRALFLRFYGRDFTQAQLDEVLESMSIHYLTHRRRG